MTKPRHADEPIRVAIVADGPVRSPRTNSGVSRGIAFAFDRRPEVDVVAEVDTRPRGLLRSILLASTVRPSRRWWWSTYNLGLANILMRRFLRDQKIRTSRQSIDLVLHVRNIHLPPRIPYVAFIDSTSTMADRNWSPWKPTRLLSFIRRRVELQYYKDAILILTAGENAAMHVRQDFGIEASKIAAIGGGVNIDPLPDISYTETSTPAILWVGLDWSRKGGDIAVAAFHQVRKSFPTAQLILVGGAAEHPNQPEIGITSLPPIFEPDRLQELYRSASVFIHPARHEPYGLVVQEAMAFGIPCVVSPTGALPSIVLNDVAGIVASANTAEAFGDAICTLLSNFELRERLGRAGRSRVETSLTWDAVAQRACSEIAVRLNKETP